jgi:hypothetical protein
VRRLVQEGRFVQMQKDSVTRHCEKTALNKKAVLIGGNQKRKVKVITKNLNKQQQHLKNTWHTTRQQSH